MRFSPLHVVLFLLLLTVGLGQIVWAVASLTFLSPHSQDVNDVLETMRGTSLGGSDTVGNIFSSKYKKYNTEVRKLLEKYNNEKDTVFWFFIVGVILAFSRSLVIASCAFKSNCLNGIRAEIIQALEEVNETDVTETVSEN